MIKFKDGSGCRFEEPHNAKLQFKERRRGLKRKLISLKLARKPNTKQPFKVNLKFLRAKHKSDEKDRIQILSMRGSTPTTTKRRLTQDANERWNREGPVTSKPRRPKVSFVPVDDDLAEDEELALNGFTTVRNGVITASPAPLFTGNNQYIDRESEKCEGRGDRSRGSPRVGRHSQKFQLMKTSADSTREISYQ